MRGSARRIEMVTKNTFLQTTKLKKTKAKAKAKANANGNTNIYGTRLPNLVTYRVLVNAFRSKAGAPHVGVEPTSRFLSGERNVVDVRNAALDGIC